MTIIDHIHEACVYSRRVRTLTSHLAKVVPPGSRVLDVGCGDGLLALQLQEKRSDIELKGIEVLIRSCTHIPVEPFDGRVIPYADASFDIVMFVDVLHHAEDPMALLREAVRVARKAIVIKDHTADGFFAFPILGFMDQVGNARHGVALPFNYWPREKWLDAFDRLGLRIGAWMTRLKLYPPPADWLFGGSLHFITRLEFVERQVMAGAATV
jgi:SAM-dependent methyltransferase